MADFKGGRGKKVGYETQMYRIPSLLKPTVERLGMQFRMLWDGLTDPLGKKLISRIEAAIPDPDQLWESDEINQISGKHQLAILDIKNQELEEENFQLHTQVAELKNNAWLQDETIRNRTEEISQLRSQLAETAQLAELFDLLQVRVAALALEDTHLREQVEELQARPAVAPEALELLQEAIKMKANAGGAIKRKIEQALALLTGANSQ